MRLTSSFQRENKLANCERKGRTKLLMAVALCSELLHTSHLVVTITLYININALILHTRKLRSEGAIWPNRD